jgi:hypothetical protein
MITVNIYRASPIYVMNTNDCFHRNVWKFPKITSNEFLRNLICFVVSEVLVAAVMKEDMTTCRPLCLLLLSFSFLI